MNGDGKFREVAKIKGSRPLAVARDGSFICYGEYHGNRDRQSVDVIGSFDGGLSWNTLFEFRGIRHVHGVFRDPYTGSFWATTGDEDSESGLWQSKDRFHSVEQVAGGSQQLRAVQLLFTAHYVYFGSDSPQTRNFLYRLHRSSGRIDRLQAVSSSVFYGCKVGSVLFFSTAAEPSAVNRADAVELWFSPDGERWAQIDAREKDHYSFRYFQYGQILFPSGPGDGRTLFYTPFAVRGDQASEAISLADIESNIPES